MDFEVLKMSKMYCIMVKYNTFKECTQTNCYKKHYIKLKKLFF